MKKFWKENRVLFGLILVLIACFVAIISVTVSYFVGSHKSIYGDRLVDKVEVSKKEKTNYLAKLKENELVKNVEFRVSIRTIYVDIEFVDTCSLVEAQSIAASSIEQLKEETLAYYDVNFILVKNKTENDAGFTIMGAKNSNGNGISWNNNTVIEEPETEE